MFGTKASQHAVQDSPLLSYAACLVGLAPDHKPNEVPALLRRGGLQPMSGVTTDFLSEVAQQASNINMDAPYFLPKGFAPVLPDSIRNTADRQSEDYGVLAEIHHQTGAGLATTFLDAKHTTAAWFYTDFSDGSWPVRNEKAPYSWLCAVSILESPFDKTLPQYQDAFESSALASSAQLRSKIRTNIGAASVVERHRSDGHFYWVDCKTPHRFGGDEWLVRFHIASTANGSRTAIWVWALRKHGMNGI